MYKKLAILGLLIVILAWCGMSFWAFVNDPCDFDSYLIDREIRDEISKALGDYKRQQGLVFDSLGLIMCVSSSEMEIPLEYETPPRFSKYGFTYWMSFNAAYFLSSKEISVQYEDSWTDKNYDAAEFVHLIEDQIIEFENSSEVQEFINNLGGRTLKGHIFGDRIEIATNRIGIPAASSGEFAQIQYSMTTHSISAYNLPNRLDWSEFSELSFAHRIIQEHYLEGELEGCSIDTERGAYANTHVLHRTDGTIRIDVNIQCPVELEKDILRIILFPDGTYKYDGLW